MIINLTYRYNLNNMLQLINNWNVQVITYRVNRKVTHLKISNFLVEIFQILSKFWHNVL